MVDVGTLKIKGEKSSSGRASGFNPICHNSSPGAGNCEGMVKYRTCPVFVADGGGKFAGCKDFIAEQQKA